MYVRDGSRSTMISASQFNLSRETHLIWSHIMEADESFPSAKHNPFFITSHHANSFDYQLTVFTSSKRIHTTFTFRL